MEAENIEETISEKELLQIFNEDPPVEVPREVSKPKGQEIPINPMKNWLERAKTILTEETELLPIAMKTFTAISDVNLEGRSSHREAHEIFEKLRTNLLAEMLKSNFGNLALADFLSQYHNDEKVKNMIFEGVDRAGTSLGWSKSEIEDTILFLKEATGKDDLIRSLSQKLESSYMLRSDYVRWGRKALAELEFKSNETFKRPAIQIPETSREEVSPQLLQEIKNESPVEQVKHEVLYVVNSCQ